MSAEAAILKPNTFRAGGLQVHRLISREGPSPTFVLYYRNSAKFFRDPDDIRRYLRLTKGSETRNRLIECFDSFDTEEKSQADFPHQRIAAEGFGPESHLDSTDPNHATKTVI